MNNSPLKAIKEKCMDCSCFDRKEVTNCPVSSCPLYEFRFGKKPKNENRKPLSEENRKAAAKRLEEGRKNKKIEVN